MSATNRGGERLADDTYYTPDALAEALVGLLPPSVIMQEPHARVLEPSVGNGAFVRALVKHNPKLWIDTCDLAPTGVSIDTVYTGSHTVGDFLNMRKPLFAPGYSLILGNPPYKHAEEHIAHALSMIYDDAIVAFLLRVGIMEGKKRAAFWHGPGACLEHVHVLAERPSFTGGGTDASAYAWFTWRKGYTGPATIQPGWSWRGAK